MIPIKKADLKSAFFMDFSKYLNKNHVLSPIPLFNMYKQMVVNITKKLNITA